MQAKLRFVADEEEREAVYRLRYEVYVERHGLFVDEADHDRRWLIDELDADSTIVVAELDGRIVGTIRITWGGSVPFRDSNPETYGARYFQDLVDESDVILVSRLAILPELRGGPLGLLLFQQAFVFAAEHDAELILGLCDVHLINHYRRLGFRPFGDIYSHPTHGVRVPIAALTGDFEYLERIGATTLDVLRRRTRPTVGLPALRARVEQGQCLVSQERQEPASYRQQVSRALIGWNGEQCALLKDLADQEVDALLARSHLLNCAAQTLLTVPGQASRTVYVLLTGSLEVCFGDVWRRVEQPGALVGEVAMLSSRPRTRRVVIGAEGARLLALSYGTLRRILAENSVLSAKLLRVLALGLCEMMVEGFQAQEKSVDRVADSAAPQVSLPERMRSTRPDRRRGRRRFWGRSARSLQSSPA